MCNVRCIIYFGWQIPEESEFWLILITVYVIIGFIFHSGFPVTDYTPHDSDPGSALKHTYDAGLTRTRAHNVRDFCGS